mmetsp:Transcript_4936/g.14855  ORF Transcript_4936/g.14855 Transcript_4936/m.14855 type:complete len:532 (+) Transcript_4936:201-1796(+)
MDEVHGLNMGSHGQSDSSSDNLGEIDSDDEMEFENDNVTDALDPRIDDAIMEETEVMNISRTEGLHPRNADVSLSVVTQQTAGSSENSAQVDCNGSRASSHSGRGSGTVVSYLNSLSIRGQAQQHLRENVMKEVEYRLLTTLDDGEYIDLDHRCVRTTISMAFSYDGRFFASTHGDHTVKVFSYPEAELVSILEMHPRTPWTVHFHPTDSNIVASGCIGFMCCVWDVKQQCCIRTFRFDSRITCVSFHPSGKYLAVVTGTKFYVWNWQEAHSRPHLFLDTVRSFSGLSLVEFHPAGDTVILGEKRPQNNFLGASSTNISSNRLHIYRFDALAGTVSSKLEIIPSVMAYSEAGVSVSMDGQMLAFCNAARHGSSEYHIRVISLTSGRNEQRKFGDVLYETPIDFSHAMALTNLKFSATGNMLLAGYSFKSTNPTIRAHVEISQYGQLFFNNNPSEDMGLKVGVVEIYHLGDGQMKRVRKLYTNITCERAEDEINAAMFAPSVGISNGVLYGTERGRIRLFRPCKASFAEPSD